MDTQASPNTPTIPNPAGPWVREHFGFSDGEPSAAPFRQELSAGAAQVQAQPRSHRVVPVTGLLAIAVAAGLLIGVHGPATSPASPGTAPVPVPAGPAGRLDGRPDAPAPQDFHGRRR
jgi:hypothetical protein